MFRAFGHKKSSILNGGLPRWESEGFAIDTTSLTSVEKAIYPEPTFDAEVVKSELDDAYHHSCCGCVNLKA